MTAPLSAQGLLGSIKEGAADIGQAIGEGVEAAGQAIGRGADFVGTEANRIGDEVSEEMVDSAALFAADTSPEEMRAQLDAMAEDAFDRLMTEQPGAAALIEPSAGYAVFDARKVSLIGLTGGAGRGVAEDAQTRIRSYMKTQLSTKQSISDFMVLKTI